MCEKEREKEPIILPFEPKEFDLGVWADTHKVVLSITVIAYLLLAIIFVSTQVVIKRNYTIDTIAIDLQELEALERERDELKRSVEELKEQSIEELQEIQNRVSNEHSLSKVSDDRGTDIEQLINDAAEFQRQMEANRMAYESGMAEVDEFRKSLIRDTSFEEEIEERQDANVSGNVTVSYSLYNPVRHSQRLTIPAYLCEGGGEVKVLITVNRMGKVLSARWISGGDECMQETAVRSALASSFNEDNRARAEQSGTITYIFIPQ